MTLSNNLSIFDRNDQPHEWLQSFIMDVSKYSSYLLWLEDSQQHEEETNPRTFTDEEMEDFSIHMKKLSHEGKCILILDLDHTIVHCTQNKDIAHGAPSFAVGDEVWYFHFRPGLIEFFETVQPLFEIHLYTFAIRPYAEQLIAAIDRLMAGRLTVDFRTLMSRNECRNKRRKSARELFPDDSMVFILDDNKGSVWADTETLIKAPPYYHFGRKAQRCPDDRHLFTLARLLQRLHAAIFQQATPCARTLIQQLRRLANTFCPLDIPALERERALRRERMRRRERQREGPPLPWPAAESPGTAETNSVAVPDSTPLPVPPQPDVLTAAWRRVLDAACPADAPALDPGQIQQLQLELRRLSPLHRLRGETVPPAESPPRGRPRSPSRPQDDTADPPRLQAVRTDLPAAALTHVWRDSDGRALEIELAPSPLNVASVPEAAPPTELPTALPASGGALTDGDAPRDVAAPAPT